MTTGEIEAFLAIYQCGNLSRAARKMTISQPALSSKLSLLEAELGCRLFQRHKGQQAIMTTREGEALYPLALQYMELQARMYEAAKLSGTGILRVCATNSISSALLMPAWELYRSRHPEIKIQMQDAETAAAYEFVSAGTMDLALTPIVDPFSKVKAIPLAEEPYIFVCDREAAYPDPITLRDLRIEDEIYVQWSETFITWHRAHLGDLSEVKLRVEMVTQLQYFLEKGGKWAFVPLSVGENLLRHGHLCRRRMGFSIPSRIISCLYMESNSAGAMRAEFIQCMTETIAQAYGDEIVILGAKNT